MFDAGSLGLSGKSSNRLFPTSSSIDLPEISEYALLAFSIVKSGAFARIRTAGSGIASNIDRYVFLIATIFKTHSFTLMQRSNLKAGTNFYPLINSNWIDLPISIYVATLCQPQLSSDFMYKSEILNTCFNLSAIGKFTLIHQSHHTQKKPLCVHSVLCYYYRINSMGLLRLPALIYLYKK